MQNIIIEDVKRTLHEDIGPGDVTSLLMPENLQVRAALYTREPLFLCGTQWFEQTFLAVDKTISLHWDVEEGHWIDKPMRLCIIEGSARHILTAERTALNFLQLLSGTATKTYQYVKAIQGTKTKILDTRKTIPGLRFAQKYAVLTAGGKNHRFGLYDQYLIKENHIRACGSITKAIEKARSLKPELFLVVEVETLAEFNEAIALLPDRILLDNFDNSMIKEAIACNEHKIPIEVSGGISLENIREIALLGVDYISIGDLTKSVQAIDLSLLID